MAIVFKDDQDVHAMWVYFAQLRNDPTVSKHKRLGAARFAEIIEKVRSESAKEANGARNRNNQVRAER